MDIKTFRRIVTAFADEAVDVDIGKGLMVAQIRDELVEAKIFQREGTIWVQEQRQEESAFNWIVRRLARLHLLADRLLTQLPEEPYFVNPEGVLLDDLETVPDSKEAKLPHAAQGIEDTLMENMAGVTRVLYLTSDAGEGKTTLINQVARTIARQFKNREIQWLLVPVSLGGRPFMALDDIVVAELTNRFRFNLYYDAFTELVKLNAVVPALDGFEEVFLETGSGEAVSALGNLINQLGGSGRVLIAARKAYFEVRSFASQARIFDTIGEDAGASFERLALSRWSKETFCEYARLRGLESPEEVHQKIAEQLRDNDHPLITRAVLVGRLIDVALEGDIDSLLASLAQDPEDYFYQFVGALIEREANTKWVDRSRLGDAASPLLTINEHLALLTQIAREMWINQTDALRADYIELIADVFSSENAKPAAIAHQIQQRLHQHSLLATRGTTVRKLAFDHEDFRLFFLGQALGNELVSLELRSLGSYLSTAQLPERTADAAISHVTRMRGDVGRILDSLTGLGKSALDTSYEKENIGVLTVRLLEKVAGKNQIVDSINFPANALNGRFLSRVEFKRCKFQSTEMSSNGLTAVSFRECFFHRIEIKSNEQFEDTTFFDCEISSVYLTDKDEVFFGPEEIEKILQPAKSVDDERDRAELVGVDLGIDHETKVAEKALRAFMRATHLNENVFRQRLGRDTNDFFDTILPALLAKQILEEIEYKGSGAQRRFKLLAPMRNIEPAIRKATDLSSFISLLKTGE